MAWVSNPARTNDELFTVELLLEAQRGYQWPFNHVNAESEAKRERAKARKLNPAHRPAMPRDELKELIARVETIKYYGGGHDDRPIRNLEAFRFFPHFENLNVQSSDVHDFSPIASLKKLTYLSIAEYGDLYGCQPISLAQCGEMPALERLHLALRHPWPDLRALADWPALIDIRYNGNLLALEDVPILPSARVVHLKKWIGNSTALRDLRKLGEMPKVRQLAIDLVASLEGIERYPSVVNLELGGCFRDLAPLAAMENVTALTLRGEFFQDLKPLARMPRLRELTFIREWPLDLSPLADCPQLRRVEFEHCAMMRTEVAALNAGLLPEALDFQAKKPRPLGPLKFYRLGDDQKEASKFFGERTQKIHEEREKFFDGDEALKAAEGRAFCTAMQSKFDELLGRGWGIFRASFPALKRYPDTLRVLELVEVIREYSAQSLFPQHVTFIVEPHADMTDDLEELKAREEKEADPDADYLMKYYETDLVLEENEDDRRQRAERYELLKREHLVRLRDETDGELLHLANDEPEAAPEIEDIEEPLAGDSGDEDEGGVAIAPPPPPPPSAEVESLSDQLMFYLDVYEDCVTVGRHWADRAQYHCGVTFVPWTDEEAQKHRKDLAS